MNLALALKALGQLDAAERQLTTAIEGGFDDPRALLIRARVRRGLGDDARGTRRCGVGAERTRRSIWRACWRRESRVLHPTPQKHWRILRLVSN